jgi:hypothetical protein
VRIRPHIGMSGNHDAQHATTNRDIPSECADDLSQRRRGPSIAWPVTGPGRLVEAPLCFIYRLQTTKGRAVHRLSCAGLRPGRGGTDRARTPVVSRPRAAARGIRASPVHPGPYGCSPCACVAQSTGRVSLLKQGCPPAPVDLLDRKIGEDVLSDTARRDPTNGRLLTWAGLGA